MVWRWRWPCKLQHGIVCSRHYQNFILGFDYLKAREADIDLSHGVLEVNGTIVKGKYKYAEGTPVRLVKDCHHFPNSVSMAAVRI